MRTLAALALVAALCATSVRADEPPLRVVVTLDYLADVVRKIGGPLVAVEVLARPGEDPHAIDPTPAHLLALRQADLLVENGVQLELWTPRAREGSGNARVQPGQPGHLFATDGIEPRELPTAEELAGGGHVHASGNPHVWLDPTNLKVVASNVERALARLRPGAAAALEQRRRAFEARLDDACFGPELVKVLGAGQLTRLHRAGRLRAFLADRKYRERPLTDLAGGWLKAALELGDLPLLTYHRTWTYLELPFGLRVVGTVEEKPGIPPSPAHLDRLQALAAREGVKVVVCAPYEPASRAQGVAERIGGVAVVLPTQPAEVGPEADVFGLFDAIFRALADARRRAGS
ncbi:MAG: zinc ABC transporter substrate-binding protein [Planctomycetota bacterium]|nr:zinc ABC transporter substrate-binding protein [Planctomycetota bacterium]